MPDTCAHCKKTGAEGTGALQLCAECEPASYYSRLCPEADWKLHKVYCTNEPLRPRVNRPLYARVGMSPQNQWLLPSASGQSFLPGGLSYGILGKSAIYAISGGLFDCMGCAGTYRRVIGSYRLCACCEYEYEQRSKGSYAGEDPIPEFRDFLGEADAKGLLPAWWSCAKRAECESLAADSCGNSYLGHAVGDHSIQKKYADRLVPLKICILVEKICCR